MPGPRIRWRYWLDHAIVAMVGLVGIPLFFSVALFIWVLESARDQLRFEVSRVTRA